jgi:hypothetical protein
MLVVGKLLVHGESEESPAALGGRDISGVEVLTDFIHHFDLIALIGFFGNLG